MICAENSFFMESYKLLIDGAESVEFSQVNTEAFRPVSNFEQLINNFNMLYQNEEDQPLLRFDDLANGTIVLTGATNEIKLNDEADEMGDLIDEDNLEGIAELIRTAESIGGMPTPKVSDELISLIFKRQDWKSDDGLFEEAAGYANLGDIIKLLMVPGQSITIQITNSEYGNSEYTLTV